MIDYNKLAQVDYLEKKKHFNRAPMPLDERASIFKPFEALQGYSEELRKVEKRHAKQYESVAKYVKGLIAGVTACLDGRFSTYKGLDLIQLTDQQQEKATSFNFLIKEQKWLIYHI